MYLTFSGINKRLMTMDGQYLAGSALGINKWLVARGGQYLAGNALRYKQVAGGQGWPGVASI